MKRGGKTGTSDEEYKRRLRKRSKKNSETGCREWVGAKKPNGYGNMAFRGAVRTAHRVALELHLGEPLPPGTYACHRCDNPSCVRVGHLFVGTAADNQEDMRLKGRMRKHTKLSDADVRAMRQQRKDGGLLREIARNFECSTSNVSLIVRGLSR